MASKLDELIRKLQEQNVPYTALTAEQIQKQAKDRYASEYDQKRLSAMQSYESQSAALDNQMKKLQSDYAIQRTDTADRFRQAYAQTNRAALGSGMQRASYTNAALANVDRDALKAQQDITNAQTKSENEIGSQKTSLAQNLAKQIGEYNIAQQSDVAKYQSDLEEREYNRLMASQAAQREIATSIYEYQRQLELEEEARRR